MPAYNAAKTLLQTYEEVMAQRNGVATYDFSSPERYQGTASGWYDCAHIDESNADRLAAVLVRQVR